MRYIFLTNDPEIAQYAEKAGVHRIMVDLETIGKAERQGHLDTVMSDHSLADVAILKAALTSSEIIVRTNPIHPRSPEEIEEAIASGADTLMLPMFKNPEEVAQFVDWTKKRARVMLLLETPEALARVDDILEVDGIDEVFIGLNDLHLGLGLNFMFELLTGGIVEYLCTRFRENKLPFGFGGLARLGTGDVDAALILSEHLRLGSNSVILSRAFHQRAESLSDLKQKLDLPTEIAKLNDHIEFLSSAPTSQLMFNKRILREKTNLLVQKRLKAA